MGTYMTVATVRRTCGIDSDEISDADVEELITEVEKQVPRYFNTAFVPTEVIEVLNGDGTNRVLLDHNPVWSVREIKIDGTTEDPVNLEIQRESGYVFLGEDALTPYFALKKNSTVVKYIHGNVEHSDTVKTTTSAAEVAGTSVSVSVASDDGFADNDWVEIYGMDGHREAAQIDGTPTGDIIILDKLVLTHEAGSTVVKLEVNATFKKVMNIIVGISMVARIIGQSYDENTGYTLGELSIQKGEPYTQWRETANQFIRERDDIMARLINRPYIV